MAVNFLLKRSSVADKRPTALQLDIGELSLNYDQGTPGLFFEDDAGNVRKVGPTEVGGTAPNASPAGQAGNSTGEMWLDNSGTPLLKTWDGSAWRVAGATTIGSTAISLGSSSTTLAGLTSVTSTNFTASTAIGLSNQAETRYYESTANGSNYVGFRAAASIGADVIWTLPVADGLADQVLKTDGSGNLGWSSGGGGGGGGSDYVRSLKVITSNTTIPTTAGYNEGALYDLEIATGAVLTISAGEVFEIQDVTSITDADISLTAAISVGKLAPGAAGQLLRTNAGGTAVEWGSSIDISGAISAGGALTVAGAVTFNEAGADVDVRMEGDTSTHLFFLDASADRIGVNQSSPATTLDISGATSSNIVAVPALNIDCSAGNFFTKTINGNSTFTVSNVPTSRAYSFTLELVHTSGSITWFSGVRWPNNTAPTLNTGTTHLFMFSTDDNGSTWRAAALPNYVS